MSETIKIPQIDYEGFEILEGSEVLIILHDDYLFYSASSRNKFTDDESGLTETKYFDNTYIWFKDGIIAIDTMYGNRIDRFSCEIRNSAGEIISVFFKDKKSATDLGKKILNWKINKSK